MNNNENNLKTKPEENEAQGRRDALKKLGKYSAYVAPFTLLALNAKAASGSGPGKHK